MNGGLPPSCAHIYSKRIEAQLQEIEQKSEKKKLEVRTSIPYSAQRNINVVLFSVGRDTDRITTTPEARWA